MKTHTFAWRWQGAILAYTLDGKPFWALINPRIWDKYVTESPEGSIEITKEELLSYDE
jgi:hypothetical protein